MRVACDGFVIAGKRITHTHTERRVRVVRCFCELRQTHAVHRKVPPHAEILIHTLKQNAQTATQIPPDPTRYYSVALCDQIARCGAWRMNLSQFAARVLVAYSVCVCDVCSDASRRSAGGVPRSPTV